MGDNGMASPSMDSEHFPSFEDRARTSTRMVSRSGRASPTHSASGSLIRASIIKMQEAKKARKVRFYRNGDRFFKGIVYAVSPERFRTFEALMSDLTDSALGDNKVLPKGVRHIFSLDGSIQLESLEDLEDGQSYVCASTSVFKQIDYPSSSSPSWNPNIANQRPESPLRQVSRQSYSRAGTPSQLEENRDFIRPKLVTVVASGSKPRKAVRILMNKKTVHSFDQVLNDVSEAIKLDSGTVRRLYSMNGKPVNTLQDFFQDESVFIAYGNERQAYDDFDLGENEVRFVSAYRSVRQKERITLRSPKAPRRLAPIGNFNQNAAGTVSRLALLRFNKTSPAPVRKSVTTSAGKAPLRTPATVVKMKMMNGADQGAADVILDAPKELTGKYKVGKLIGEGNFASVRECYDKAKRKPFALKIIDKEKCRGKEHMIVNELGILRKISHPNIIALIEDYETPSELYLVMELIKGGDLFDAISETNKYTERDASGMLYNLSSALKYLHTNDIVHRDIKPENLMICEHEDGTKSLKLGDFGLATEIHDELLHTVCGTPTYVAPEVIAEDGYGKKVDVWSAGVITYILLCGFPPFVSPENDQDDLFDRIIEGRFRFPSPYWDEVSDSAKELLQGMLDKDPEARLTAAQVLDHPWVSADTAGEEELKIQVTSSVKRPRKFKGPPEVALLMNTPLDTGSRYFEGRGHIALQHHPNSLNEVF